MVSRTKDITETEITLKRVKKNKKGGCELSKRG